MLTVSNYVTMDNNLGCIEDYYICHGNDRDNNVGVARKIWLEFFVLEDLVEPYIYYQYLASASFHFRICSIDKITQIFLWYKQVRLIVIIQNSLGLFTIEFTVCSGIWYKKWIYGLSANGYSLIIVTSWSVECLFKNSCMKALDA